MKVFMTTPSLGKNRNGSFIWALLSSLHRWQPSFWGPNRMPIPFVYAARHIYKTVSRSMPGKVLGDSWLPMLCTSTNRVITFSLHPTERLQVALQREKELQASRGGGEDIGTETSSILPPFVFIVNITLPGPPYHHGVFYFGVDDRSAIDGTDGTPSSILCNKFFFGESDEFRDKTFKLIPTVVKGTFLVRKAIGSTPCIMGKKVKQHYVRNHRFFELTIDNSDSPAAGGVIKIALGYARTLVVDLGFLLEGQESKTLPERLFGAVRIKRLRFQEEIRTVPTLPSVQMPSGSTIISSLSRKSGASNGN